MNKININDLPEESWVSPKGKFAGAGRQVSEALGRNPQSTDLRERHPFDVEILRVEPGQTPYPYHSHSAQWEFYRVMAGSGFVRDDSGRTSIGPGDAFLFKPGEPHQIVNDGNEDLIICVVADNPVSDCYYYPDSDKWGVPGVKRQFIRSNDVDRFDGEE